MFKEVKDLQELLESYYNQENDEIPEEEIIERLKSEALPKLCKVNFNLKEDIENLKVEENNIHKKRKEKEKILDLLKRSILDTMKQSGKEKIENGSFTISLRYTKSVNIIDEDILPLEFKRVIYEPNKIAIKEAITNGTPVEGAELVTNTSVLIK